MKPGIEKRTSPSAASAHPSEMTTMTPSEVLSRPSNSAEGTTGQRRRRRDRIQSEGDDARRRPSAALTSRIAAGTNALSIWTSETESSRTAELDRMSEAEKRIPIGTIERE